MDFLARQKCFLLLNASNWCKSASRDGLSSNGGTDTTRGMASSIGIGWTIRMLNHVHGSTCRSSKALCRSSGIRTTALPLLLGRRTTIGVDLKIGCPISGRVCFDWKEWLRRDLDIRLCNSAIDRISK